MPFTTREDTVLYLAAYGFDPTPDTIEFDPVCICSTEEIGFISCNEYQTAGDEGHKQPLDFKLFNDSIMYGEYWRAKAAGMGWYFVLPMVLDYIAKDRAERLANAE